MSSLTHDQILEKLRDEEILSLTIWGEGRGEPIEGQIAIGSVIRNRVVVGDYKNYKAACLAPYQFSCWNKNDPNYPLLIDLADRIVNRSGLDDRDFNQIHYLSLGIINKVLKSNIGSATNYVTNALFASQTRPDWVGKMTIVANIGRHMFLRK